MTRNLLKQLLPFVILLVVLWLVATLLEKTMTSGPDIVAEPRRPTPTPLAKP